MRKVLFAVVIVVLLAAPGLGEELKKDEGFRGIKWGTPFSEVDSQMVHVVTDPAFAHYRRRGDELKIGEASLLTLEYVFWQGKFFGVQMTMNEWENFNRVKDATIARFGKAHQPNRYIDEHFWFTNAMMMQVKYSRATNKGSVIMFSRDVENEKKHFDRDQAKLGAESGF
jgi:hypothetical protein